MTTIDDFLIALRADGVDPSDVYLHETREQYIIRKAVTRALTAQAWAVACMAQWTDEWAVGMRDRAEAEKHPLFHWTLGLTDSSTKNMGRLANLPAPADLALDLLGYGKGIR